MQPECKAEKRFLIDVDNIEKLDDTRKFLIDNDIKIFEETRTPNGYHFVVKPFDTRRLNIDEVELVKDGMLFIEKIENEVKNEKENTGNKHL